MNSAQHTLQHTPQPPEHWTAFRERREHALAAPHGVLAQVALHWIAPGGGEQSFDGLPGRWHLGDDGLAGVAAEGEELEILEGTASGVRRVRVGADIEIEVIVRGGRTGLRVLDPATPRRTDFTGVPTGPYAPDAVLRGSFTARPAEVTVGSALPWLEQQLPSPGTAQFEIDGETVELVLTGERSLLFTDETSGTTSADWRVVEAELEGGTITVDLNRAVNFPAAFSAWATCPRPPAGNHLPIAVEAGERRVARTER
ncbi:DUF1684 domain-containing protein [Brachybacterium sp.]|uniref:DUF1684 domain-containing protein n=1 Tax=Brachybacterium sp. TaxID=1891286 RepID=UPI002ED0C1C1